METFRVELARVPFQIRCVHAENRRFFSAYLTDRDPLFTIEPQAADLEQMQAEFDRMRNEKGIRSYRRQSGLLENEAIHGLIAERLTDYNVLLIHGSALCMDDRAYIFIAPSGTGKSTHARLWREAFGERVWMINDDKPMVRIGEEGAEVYGTPWDGKHHLSRNASAPLKAIVCLQRDKVNRISPMNKADAFPLLMRQTYFTPGFPRINRVVEIGKQLLDTIRFFDLGCNAEPDAAIKAWEGLNAN